MKKSKHAKRMAKHATSVEHPTEEVSRDGLTPFSMENKPQHD